LKFNYFDVGNKIKEVCGLDREVLKGIHPVLHWLQAEFVDCTEEGKLTLAYPVLECQRNGLFAMQGGIITTCIDNNYGLFMQELHYGNDIVSINITTHFHNEVTKDKSKIWVISRVVKRGKRVMHLAAEVFDENKDLIASSSGNFMIIDRA